jgi:hypothetical protein
LAADGDGSVRAADAPADAYRRELRALEAHGALGDAGAGVRSLRR